MAAPGKPTGTVQHLVFVKHSAAGTALVSSGAPGAYTDVVGSGKLVVKAEAGDSAHLEGATVFGPIDLSGNPVSYTPLGSGTTKTVAGAADLGEFPLRFVPTESGTIDAAILGAKIGDVLEAVCVKVSGDAAVAYYVGGEISGLNMAFDTPAEAEVRIALAARPTRLPKTG